MKISISKSLYTHALSSFAGLIASSAVHAQEVNPDLSSTSEAKSFFKNIPFYSKIENVANRVGSLTRTEDELILEVSDEFLKDMIDLSVDSAKSALPLIIAQIKHTQEFAIKAKVVSDKWFPPVVTETTVK